MITMFKCEDGSLFHHERVLRVDKSSEGRLQETGKPWYVVLNGNEITSHYISQNDYERFMKLVSDGVIKITII